MSLLKRSRASPEIDLSDEKKYKLLEIVGEGIYGIVGRYLNTRTNEVVALKILKKNPFACENFRMEKEIYECMKKRIDSDRFNLVRLLDSFECRGYYCMAFENLDQSIHSLFKKKKVFSLSQIRPIAKQLLMALSGMQIAGVVHCDIKPDNIMLVDQEKQPFKVKLIDFGLATLSNELRTGVTIQNLHWRSPEVSLGLPLSHGVDMWSLGCCLVLWYLGHSLFSAKSPHESLSKIVHFLGTPPEQLLNKGMYTTNYFVTENSKWRLKTLREFRNTTGQFSTLFGSPLTAHRHLKSLIMEYRPFEGCLEINDRNAFYDLLSRMFELDPKKRISPHEALLHPFITMDHLSPGEYYTLQAQNLMGVVEHDLLQPQGLGVLEETDRKRKAKVAKKSAANGRKLRKDESVSDSDTGTESLGEICVHRPVESTVHMSDENNTFQTNSGRKNMGSLKSLSFKNESTNVKCQISVIKSTNTDSKLSSAWSSSEEGLDNHCEGRATSQYSMKGKLQSAPDVGRSLTSINSYSTSSSADDMDIEQVEGKSDQEKSLFLDPLRGVLHKTIRKLIKEDITFNAEEEDTSTDGSTVCSEVDEILAEKLAEHMRDDEFTTSQRQPRRGRENFAPIKVLSCKLESTNTDSSTAFIEKVDTTGNVFSEVNETERLQNQEFCHQGKSRVFDPLMEETRMRCRKIIDSYLERIQEVAQSEINRAASLSSVVDERCTASNTTSNSEEAVLECVKEEQPTRDGGKMSKTKKRLRRKNRISPVIGDSKNINIRYQPEKESPHAESVFTRFVQRPIQRFISVLVDPIKNLKMPHFSKPKWMKRFNFKRYTMPFSF